MSNIEYKPIRISNRIIEHLGKDLITTPDVAVTELVKNAIDANSKKIRIQVFNSFEIVESIHDSFLTKYNCSIKELIPQNLLSSSVCVIEDIGEGMNDYQIDNGFLTVGTDLKKNENSIRFGEKGIGRLAAQRLGRYLLIETASKEEDNANLVFIDWHEISNYDDSTGDSKKNVKSVKISKLANNYTRLWIFDINKRDFFETPEQMLLNLNSDTPILVNRELKTAINYLVSPFIDNDITIEMRYDGIKLDTSFRRDLLEMSESCHSFMLNFKNHQLELDYSMSLKPWYIERIHRAAVGNEAFKRLRKPHSFYKEILDKNLDRVKNALSHVIDVNEISELLRYRFNKEYRSSIPDRKSREQYINNLINVTIGNLEKIIPIFGKVYTFKKGTAIGERIIISSINELRKKEEKTAYQLNELNDFIDNNNGIKLYRDFYRIGYLGNSDNDWLKLQQYRTTGQQYYRLDLANTVGYVSIHDDIQEYIQEISSRLDIQQNDVSVSFKIVLDIIINNLFYELNRTATNLIRVFLEEEGLLVSNLENNIKKKNHEIIQSLNKSKQLEKEINVIIELLKYKERNNRELRLAIEEQDVINKTLNDISIFISLERENQRNASSLLEEANEQLKAVEVEAYNNYKLMANGLITETITHELDSVCKTSKTDNIETHFDGLKKALLLSKQTIVYNNHVLPIRKSYYNVANKIEEVSDLYNFLEKTFIHKGTYDEFQNQNINELVIDIQKNLDELKKADIEIDCSTGDLAWFVPKGVLIHVFYNLITNSIYWIDRRRKYEISDQFYKHEGKDRIVIESDDPNEIIFYDTGTGVIKPMEDVLFQPLESGKSNNTGRGMGLYIVQQLLRSFSADIELDDCRNIYGNRFRFIITLKTEDTIWN